MKNNKLKYILLAVFFSFFLIPKKSEAVDLGPFSVTIGFCQNIQKVGAIVNATTIVQWPVGGYPGVVYGMLQNTSAIMTFCNYLIQLQQLEGTEALFLSANYLNELTGKKWDAHLQQFNRTMNVATSIYDFENGAVRKGAFESASTYSELSDYVKETRQWYSKSFTGQDADVRNRTEKENDMQRFAGLAYQRAILKDMVNCPDPDEDVNYSQEYKDEVQSREYKRQDYESEYMFFKDKLFQMGPKFLNSEEELKAYISEVERLEADGYTYKINEKERNEATKKPTGEYDKNGNAKFKSVNLKRVIQTVTIDSSGENLFERFSTKYQDNWDSFVDAKVMETSEGLLDSPKERIQREFRDVYYECRESKLMKGQDPNAPDYTAKYNKEFERCQQNLVINEKQVKNLFVYYVAKFKENIRDFKKINAEIWTIQSDKGGLNRFVTKKNQNGFQQEEVNCGQNLTIGEMNKLSLKNQSVNAELNETIAKETLKESARDEARDNAVRAYNEEQVKKGMMAEKQRETLSKSDRKATGSFVAPTGGFGKKQRK